MPRPKNLQHDAASLFDLDHTLLKVNSSFSFGKFLYRRGLLGPAQLFHLGFVYALHTLGFFSITSVHKIVFKNLFCGRPSSFFEKEVHLFLEENFDEMLNEPVIERLKKAQANNHFVAILSSSPEFLVKAMANRLGVSHFDASVYAVDEKMHFLRIDRLVQGKDKALWTAAAAQNQSITMSNIAVYSDSILDLPFLQSGGIRIAVNPDSKLRKLCRLHKWEIIS
ncbi:MAG: haloacid dehalogenase-like hydrolase [Parachlamydiaceae bacterium]|nr:haloacid dehalogenase-like hydrolase [Parachlamydiaceae bacterium]